MDDSFDQIQHNHLEEALNNLQSFSAGKGDVPTLAPLKLYGTTLQIQKLSSIEKALSCLVESLSKQKKALRQDERLLLKQTLLHSRDEVKLALIRYRQGQKLEKRVEERLLKVVDRYNATITSAKKGPTSLYGRLKYYFYKAADWLLDEELQQSQITADSSVCLHKIAHGTHDARIDKICSTLEGTPACPQEIDFFYAKAYTLLKQHEMPKQLLKEALASLRAHPVETQSAHSIISLKSSFSPLPGEVIELQGNFSRTLAMSIPIKESFSTAHSALQTGYPHPLQQTGFAFSEKLLPPFLVRPFMAPKFATLLEKKKTIASQLMPKGPLNEKAKNLFLSRKKVFSENKKELLPLIKAFLLTLFEAADCDKEAVEQFVKELEKEPLYFEQMSFIHAEACELFIKNPIDALEKKWLENSLKTDSDIEKVIKESYPKEVCVHGYVSDAPLSAALTDARIATEVNSQRLFTRGRSMTDGRAPQEGQALNTHEHIPKEPLSVYLKALGAVFEKALPPLAILLFADRLKIKPLPLPLLSQKIFIATTSELKDFYFELENFAPSPHGFVDWISLLLNKKITLFSSKEVSDPLLQEFERYVIERAHS